MSQLFCSLWWPITGGLLFSLLACILRRWSIASTAAGWSAVTGGLVFGVLLLLLVGMRFDATGVGRLVLRAVANDSLEPGQKARALAETISMMMNCGALACIGAFVSALVWALARWRIAAGAG